VSLQKEDRERKGGKRVLAPHEGYVSLLFPEHQKKNSHGQLRALVIRGEGGPGGREEG
jgi:NAD(P)H-hydrate repair Nnr-like enzyme with NAD(P)H-hydrate dehydratase domain